MIVATNNKGKLEEIKKIFKDYELYSLKDKGINIDVVEDGNNFLENAKKKAKYIYDITGEAVIADVNLLYRCCTDEKCVKHSTSWKGSEYKSKIVDRYNRIINF